MHVGCFIFGGGGGGGGGGVESRPVDGDGGGESAKRSFYCHKMV